MATLNSLVILEMPPVDPSRFNCLFRLQKKINFEILYVIPKNPFKDDYEVDQKELHKLLEKHSANLEDRIREIDPGSIMVCGRNLSLMFTNLGVQEAMGKHHTFEIQGVQYPLIVNYSPARVHNNIALEKEFTAMFGVPWESSKTPYKIVKSMKEVKQVFQHCLTTGYMAFDFETINLAGGDALEWFREETLPTVLSISFQAGYSYLIPLYHVESQFKDKIPEIWEYFTEVMTTPTMQVIAHNLKYDYHFYIKLGGVDATATLHDTLLMKQKIDENTRNGLKETVAIYFPQYAGYDDGIDFKGGLDQLCEYAAIDTDMCIRLFYLFRSLMITETDHQGKQDLRIYRVYRNYDMVAFRPLFYASHRGAKIDRDAILESIEVAQGYLEGKEKAMRDTKQVLEFERARTMELKRSTMEDLEKKLEEAQQKQKESTQKKIEKIELEIQALSKDDKNYDKKVQSREVKILELRNSDNIPSASVQKIKDKIKDTKLNPPTYKINFASVQQLSDLIYGEDGFNYPPFMVDDKPTKTTSRDYLSQLRDPFFQLLFAYRTISKMISTYYEGILEKLDDQDYLHGNFNLAGAVTGRISSSDPNLQNIPVRIPYKDEQALWSLKQVKKFFIPSEKGRYLIQADYSQAELRIIANFSKDPTMIQAYLNNEDLHLKTALQIHNLTREEYDALPVEEQQEKRNHGKPANFGWVYKASIPGYIEFAKSNYGIDLTPAQAQMHKDAIFMTYPNIQLWHDEMEKKAKTYGFVRTLFGRKRRLPDIYSSVPSLYNQAVRHAINSPVQGTAGELTIFTLSVFYLLFPHRINFFNTVHDSIYYDVAAEDLDWVVRELSKLAENPPIKTYFGRDFEPVKMKLDFEVSNKSWGDMETYQINP